jgi:deoxycytidine triphosphate deaminase
MIHVASDKSRSNITAVDDTSVQPNALDIRLDKVFKILNTEFVMSEESKTHRGTVPLETDAEGYYRLEPGAYEFVAEGTISIGDDEAGWVITRSSLNRNGVFLTSGLYDSKYNGCMAGALHVAVGTAIIKKGTRIGQFLLFNAEMLHAYNGDYGFDERGSPKGMEAKYHQ